MGSWTVMVQREIADRLRAAPGSRTYGSPSVLAQLACEVRLVRTVDPAVFRPRPRIESAILGLRRTGPGGRPGDPRPGPRRLRPPPQVAGPLARARPRPASSRRPAPPSTSSACPRTRAPRRCRLRISPPCRRSCRRDLIAAMPIHAPAKLNLCLFLGPRREDGLHELCSLFEPLALADAIEVSEAGPRRGPLRGGRGREPCGAGARRRCASGAGRGRRCGSRSRSGSRSPRGSAAAPPTRRRCCGWRGRRGRRTCEQLAAELGADVPSQLDPSLALVRGAGERVERLPDPEPHAVVLLPGGGGLATAEVFAEADRLGLGRGEDELEALAARLLTAAGAGASPLDYAELLENDLEPAARALRPDVGEALGALREAGAPLALLTGSGPTAFGLFADLAAARAAAERIDRDDAIVCEAGRRAMRLPGGTEQGLAEVGAEGRDRRRRRRRLRRLHQPGRHREGARGRLPGPRRLDLPAGRGLRLRRDRGLRRPSRPRRDGDDPRRRHRRPGRDRHLPADRDRLGLRIRRRLDQLLHRPPARARVPDAPRPALRHRRGAAGTGRRLLRAPWRQNDLPRPLRRLRARLRALHRRQLRDALPGLRPLQHPRHRALGQQRARSSATSSRATSTRHSITPAKAPSRSAR